MAIEIMVVSLSVESTTAHQNDKTSKEVTDKISKTMVTDIINIKLNVS